MFVVHTDSTTDRTKVLVDLWYLRSTRRKKNGAGVLSTAVLRLHMKHDGCNYRSRYLCIFYF